jgi:hypothetical protein
VSLDAAPFLRVASPSGFAYRVHLRGDTDAPHSRDCPDFEANRLHACKHVERVRAYLRAKEGTLPAVYRRAAARPRVYLHFGEVVESRLLGRPEGAAGRSSPTRWASGRPFRRSRPLCSNLSMRIAYGQAVFVRSAPLVAYP